jgi:hypothetical protein
MKNNVTVDRPAGRGEVDGGRGTAAAGDRPEQPPFDLPADAEFRV